MGHPYGEDWFDESMRQGAVDWLCSLYDGTFSHKDSNGKWVDQKLAPELAEEIIQVLKDEAPHQVWAAIMDASWKHGLDADSDRCADRVEGAMQQMKARREGGV